MELRTYLEQDPKRAVALADALAVHWTTIYRWARGENAPSMRRIPAIERATNGAVTAADFVPREGRAA